MTLNPQEELLERARKVIRELREKLTTAEARSQSEPVAIIGMGLRFPGCDSDPEQFWRMIAEGRDAVKLLDAWKKQFPKLKLSCVGKIVAGEGVLIRGKSGSHRLAANGYVHFA